MKYLPIKCFKNRQLGLRSKGVVGFFCYSKPNDQKYLESEIVTTC